MTFQAVACYMVECNSEGCRSIVFEAFKQKVDAQANARRLGWRCVAEDHLCPKCLKVLGERP